MLRGAGEAAKGLTLSESGVLSSAVKKWRISMIVLSVGDSGTNRSSWRPVNKRMRANRGSQHPMPLAEASSLQRGEAALKPLPS